MKLDKKTRRRIRAARTKRAAKAAGLLARVKKLSLGFLLANPVDVPVGNGKPSGTKWAA